MNCTATSRLSISSIMPSKWHSSILALKSAMERVLYVFTVALVFWTITMPFLSSALVTAKAPFGRLSKKSFFASR